MSVINKQWLLVSRATETAPNALIGLFKGRNFGKQLVKLI